jgi:hypothetical protein
VSDQKWVITTKVRDLKNGETVPCDGRIYRDSDGTLWFGIRYDPTELESHQALIALIQVVEKREAE